MACAGVGVRNAKAIDGLRTFTWRDCERRKESSPIWR